MKNTFGSGIAILAAALLASLGIASAGCGKASHAGDLPTIGLFTPEPGTVARQYVAITGETTGDVAKVDVQIDGGTPRRANGAAEWALTLDVSTIPDGAHVIVATATDHHGRTAQTLPLSFIAASGATSSTRILGGSVSVNTNSAVPGATVSLFDDPGLVTQTDSTGRWALVGVPPQPPALVRGSAQGQVDTLLYRIGGNADDLSVDVPLFTPQAVAFIADSYGVSWTPGTAVVVGLVLDTSGHGQAGATVQISPTPGQGPFYVAADGTFDPALTATTAAGTFVAFDVPAGGPVSFTASNGAAVFYVSPSEAEPDALSIVVGARAPAVP